MNNSLSPAQAHKALATIASTTLVGITPALVIFSQGLQHNTQRGAGASDVPYEEINTLKSTSK